MKLPRVPALVARTHALLVLTTHHDAARVRHRAHLLLLLTELESLHAVHTLRGWSPQNRSQWMHRVLDQGPSGVQDGPRSGRPRGLGDADGALLVEMVEHHSPPARG
jgi:hypothetical protein